MGRVIGASQSGRSISLETSVAVQGFLPTVLHIRFSSSKDNVGEMDGLSNVLMQQLKGSVNSNVVITTEHKNY